jgi:hypothetical protein
MPSQRTELRDELKAIIAAGRDLTPEHDEALAEVFLDHVDERTQAGMRLPRWPMVMRRTRRLIAAVCLAGACVGGGAIAVFHGPAGASGAPPSYVVKVQPALQGKGLGGLKNSKVPVIPKVAPEIKSP